MERALSLTQAGLQWGFAAATLPAGALLLASDGILIALGRGDRAAG